MKTWRQDEEAEALQVDLYLESLLTAREPAARDAGWPPPGAGEGAAEVILSRLVRFHPSFRFEEALAGRLRARAQGSVGSGALTAFPALRPPVGVGPPERPVRAGRPVLIAGAIASGVSLAGAALFAWRAASPSWHPFARAVRADPRAAPPVAEGPA